MSDIKTNEEEGKKSLNFIEAMVEKDLAEGKTRDVCKHASRPNQTDTCISDMPKPSVWISALHKNMEVFATYASTIPIR